MYLLEVQFGMFVIKFCNCKRCISLELHLFWREKVCCHGLLSVNYSLNCSAECNTTSGNRYKVSSTKWFLMYIYMRRENVKLWLIKLYWKWKTCLTPHHPIPLERDCNTCMYFPNDMVILYDDIMRDADWWLGDSNLISWMTKLCFNIFLLGR